MVRMGHKRGSKGCKPSGANIYRNVVYSDVNQVNDKFLKVYIFRL